MIRSTWQWHRRGDAGTGNATVTFSGSGSHTVDATANTLRTGDKLTGTGSDTLALSGGGTINLNTPNVFTGFSTVTLDIPARTLNVGNFSLTVTAPPAATTMSRSAAAMIR